MPDLPQPGQPNGVSESERVLLERFRIVKPLGRGGMGEVLLAEDTLLNRPVALKRLRPDSGETHQSRSTILHEARRASRITSPYVAAIYDVLQIGDDVLIVMEYIDGVTLRKRMTRPLTLDQFWSVAAQCAEGIAAAHETGLVHRDIKPENLMVAKNDRIKILDFGLAKRSATFEGPASMSTAPSTHGVAGTPAYMSPEAHLGNALDERSDLFSLGVVFYELLTARHPFVAPTYGAMLHMLLNMAPEPVSELNPAAGKTLSDLVARMMEKSPDDRIASCTEVIEGLERARASSPGPGDWAPVPAEGFAPPTPGLAPPSRSRTRTRPWLIPSLVGAVILAALGVVWSRSVPQKLPELRNVAVLAPVLDVSTRQDAFALGLVDLLHRRLRTHSTVPGFQVASFEDAVDEQVQELADARAILGANLALVPHITLTTDELRAQLELFDTARGRRLDVREIQMPAIEPFPFLDAVYAEASSMLGLEPEARTTQSAAGIRGAGTMRFYLEGLGRIRATRSEQDARAAVDRMESACRAEPGAGVPQAGLASAYLGLYARNRDASSIDDAERSAREAIELDPERPEPHRALARVEAVRRNHPAALASWTRVVALDPTDDGAILRKGRTFARMGDRESERAVYMQAAAERPHCWTPHWWLATWYFRGGQVDSAITQYEAMIRRAPELHKGYSSLGGLLTLRGDYARAIETLKTSVALRPTKTAFDNLGTAYFNSGRLEDAADAYNQAFQFGSATYESWINLGDAYYWLHDRREQATEAYRQAVALARSEIVERSLTGGSADVMIDAHLAAVYPKLGQPDSARVHLSRALEMGANNPMVDYCAALTYWQLGERETAVQWLGRSVDGGYPAVWLRDSPVFREWQESPGYRAIVGEAVVDESTSASTEGV